VAFGPNLFHNLMTFTAWATDLVHVMPDLISTYDVHAWRWALGVYAFLALAAWQAPAQRRTIGIGLAWWLLALIPVLPLVTHTYRHYFYAALPGLALAVTAAAAGLIARFATERDVAPGAPAAPTAAATAAILVALSIAYAVRADHQIERRVTARIAGVDLAMDPVLRRQQVAGRALSSIAQSIDKDSHRLAILSPEESAHVFGVRSGTERAPTTGARAPYDLLAESIDRTGGVRLFFPQIDSVAFLSRWTPGYRDFDLFVPYQDGRLIGMGRGPSAQLAAAAWMMEQRWPRSARDHLSAALDAYPDNRELRLAHAQAMDVCGDSVGAAVELRRVIASGADDSAAEVARRMLRLPHRGGPPRP
jgi:prepilin signal peptidase PulO-like enzyme (type II secretory pathway)